MFLKRPSSPTPGRAQRNGESGQALIETAITMGLLAILFVGAAELGRVAFAAIEVVNAAKAAVQYGDQSRTTAGDTQGMQLAASQDAPVLTNLTTTPSDSCICADGTPVACDSTGPPYPCPGSVLVETLTVQTSTTFNPLLHIPGLPDTFTLTGQAVQQVLSSD